MEDSYYNGTHYPGKFTEEEEEINRSIYIGADSAPRYHQKKYEVFWTKDQYGRLHMADHPILSNMKKFTELVENPAYNPADPDSRRYVSKYGAWEYTTPDLHLYNSPLTAEELKRALKQSAGGWAPAASITVNFTDYARTYLRYTETLRYPSVFEGTYGIPVSTRSNDTVVKRYGYLWKPEHGKNWEIGYVHDLTGLFPKMRKADFRINYFRNTTKNIIDRNDNLEFEQYDKQLRTGAEISARFDSGRYYGSFGLIRTIRNEVCHATAQVENHTLTGHLISGGSKPLLKYPQCVPGGMDFSGYLVSMQQPRWSADAELGTRLLNGKLDLGARLHWHNDVHKNYITAFRDFIRDANKYYDANLTYESPDNMRWAATTVVDAYVRYRINKKFTAELVGTNLTNRYYMDPFSRSFMPAPGRTFRIGLTGKW